jgi:hypothetical protein
MCVPESHCGDRRKLPPTSASIVERVMSVMSVRSVADERGRSGRWRMTFMAVEGRGWCVDRSKGSVWRASTVKEEAESSWMACSSQGQGSGGGQAERWRRVRGRRILRLHPPSSQPHPSLHNIGPSPTTYPLITVSSLRLVPVPSGSRRVGTLVLPMHW